jgi:hypothetical protein
MIQRQKITLKAFIIPYMREVKVIIALLGYQLTKTAGVPSNITICEIMVLARGDYLMEQDRKLIVSSTKNKNNG